ncbi:hypothetical protein SAMN02746065_1176 [Desulfocicer vacuolatum DSM 3385]|uniref:Uncharacterized protein n=1 Tax=Desulfocicer vacuolatum DSM 3385 TaxID=1121400 RepID=A0A1W2DD55_9BACT|nr:hypothetical protein SAMN02746065_1176 [Desulfocicer vacuolatum DSM 3385]
MGGITKLVTRLWSAWDFTSMASATAREANRKLFSKTAAQNQIFQESTTPNRSPGTRMAKMTLAISLACRFVLVSHHGNVRHNILQGLTSHPVGQCQRGGLFNIL